jgi:SpoVK/Ycf46/Vps4 family AAA+-type ATPase
MIPVKSKLTVSNKNDSEEIESLINDIDQLVGMDNIKHQLNQLIAFGRLIVLRRERDIPMEKISLHLVFTGPPGTGKTIMARKIGGLFKSIGLLRKGHCIEVDRSKIGGGYLGQAGQLVRDAVKDALDGVLFIDEAYSLAGGTGDIASSDPYGNEAVQTLVKLMEDYRERLVVIVAGYSIPMERFLRNNPGLKSRFNREFVFLPYECDELMQILRVMMNNGGYNFDGSVEKEANKYIQSLDRKREDFGNAREIRNFYELVMQKQAYRIAATEGFESMSNEELLTITADDVRAAA